MTHPEDAQRALIYTMTLMSAADGDMSDRELREMREDVAYLPVFRGFDLPSLPAVATECANLLAAPEGLDGVIELIRRLLPPDLRETAYALACDVAVADGAVTAEEARLLEFLRSTLRLDPLICAAIERGSRARHATLPGAAARAAPGPAADGG